MRYLFLVIFTFVASALGAAERPRSVEMPFQVQSGEYYLSFPPDWDGVAPLPAILFYHGHNSSGLSPLRSRGLRENFLDRGYLLISPNGVARSNGVRAWPAWPGHGGGRDDVAFSLAVLDDVANKVSLQSDKTIVSGFSAGGSMAWMMGCYAGGRFAAVISVAGALREPHPDDLCPNPTPQALQVHDTLPTSRCRSKGAASGIGIRAMFTRPCRCSAAPTAAVATLIRLLSATNGGPGTGGPARSAIWLMLSMMGAMACSVAGRISP